MGATACLLWLFGAAGIACTYLFSFAFLVRTTQSPLFGCEMCITSQSFSWVIGHFSQIHKGVRNTSCHSLPILPVQKSSALHSWFA